MRHLLQPPGLCWVPGGTQRHRKQLQHSRAWGGKINPSRRPSLAEASAASVSRAWSLKSVTITGTSFFIYGSVPCAWNGACSSWARCNCHSFKSNARERASCAGRVNRVKASRAFRVGPRRWAALRQCHHRWCWCLQRQWSHPGNRRDAQKGHREDGVIKR